MRQLDLPYPSHRNIRVVVRDRFVPYMIIFTALGMLLCCFLACLLAIVCFGISYFKHSSFSQFNDIVEFQNEIFALSFGMLAVNSIMVYITLSNPFPSVDPAMVQKYLSGRNFSKYVMGISWAVLLASFFLSGCFR